MWGKRTSGSARTVPLRLSDCACTRSHALAHERALRVVLVKIYVCGPYTNGPPKPWPAARSPRPSGTPPPPSPHRRRELVTLSCDNSEAREVSCAVRVCVFIYFAYSFVFQRLLRYARYRDRENPIVVYDDDDDDRNHYRRFILSDVDKKKKKHRTRSTPPRVIRRVCCRVFPTCWCELASV